MPWRNTTIVNTRSKSRFDSTRRWGRLQTSSLAPFVSIISRTLVPIFSASPTMVKRFGATHNGQNSTNHFQNSCMTGSNNVTPSEAYLCSFKRFNCCSVRTTGMFLTACCASFWNFLVCSLICRTLSRKRAEGLLSKFFVDVAMIYLQQKLEMCRNTHIHTHTQMHTCLGVTHE